MTGHLRAATVFSALLLVAGHAEAAVIGPITVNDSVYGGTLEAYQSEIFVQDRPPRTEGVWAALPAEPNSSRRVLEAGSLNNTDLRRQVLSSSTVAGARSNLFTEAKAFQTFQYYFTITGPQTIDVPVLIEASGSTRVTGGIANTYSFAEATSSFALLGFRQTLVQGTANSRFDSSSSSGAKTDAFRIDDTYALQSNALYGVRLTVDTRSQIAAAPQLGIQVDNLTAFATIDPYFQIGAGFSDYALVFSTGIVNSPLPSGPLPNVPLPGSLPLFGAALLGLAGVGFGLRPRRLPAVG